MKNIKISEKGKIALLSLSLLAIIVGFYMFYYKPNSESMTALNKERDKISEAMSSTQKLILSEDDVSKEFEEVLKESQLKISSLEPEYKEENLEDRMFSIFKSRNIKVISTSLSGPQVDKIEPDYYEKPVYSTPESNKVNEYNNYNGVKTDSDVVSPNIKGEEVEKTKEKEKEVKVNYPLAIVSKAIYNIEVDYTTFLQILDDIDRLLSGIRVSEASYSLMDKTATLTVASYSIGEIDDNYKHTYTSEYFEHQLKKAGSEIRDVDYTYKKDRYK